MSFGKKPEGDYEVGYCKPPKETRFGPGNNANPRGRPKGSRNKDVTIDDLLLEPLPLGSGRKGVMQTWEVNLRKLIARALRDNDHKAQAEILKLTQERGIGERDMALEEPLGTDDEEVLKVFVDDLLHKNIKPKQP